MNEMVGHKCRILWFAFWKWKKMGTNTKPLFSTFDVCTRWISNDLVALCFYVWTAGNTSIFHLLLKLEVHFQNESEAFSTFSLFAVDTFDWHSGYSVRLCQRLDEKIQQEIYCMVSTWGPKYITNKTENNRLWKVRLDSLLSNSLLIIIIIWTLSIGIILV